MHTRERCDYEVHLDGATTVSHTKHSTTNAWPRKIAPVVVATFPSPRSALLRRRSRGRVKGSAALHFRLRGFMFSSFRARRARPVSHHPIHQHPSFRTGAGRFLGHVALGRHRGHSVIASRISRIGVCGRQGGKAHRMMPDASLIDTRVEGARWSHEPQTPACIGCCMRCIDRIGLLLRAARESLRHTTAHAVHAPLAAITVQAAPHVQRLDPAIAGCYNSTDHGGGPGACGSPRGVAVRCFRPCA